MELESVAFNTWLGLVGALLGFIEAQSIRVGAASEMLLEIVSASTPLMQRRHSTGTSTG
jgi:TRAP-type C4-dicarboxylate transport system permease small subunit